MQNVLTKDYTDDLDCLQTGIAFYNDTLDLIFANQTIRNYLPKLYELLDQGLSFQEAVFEQSKLTFSGMSDREHAAKADYIVKTIISSGALEVTTSDGLKLNSTYNKTPKGGYIITTTDVTNRVKNEQKLLKERHDADIANKAKTEFLANMSHEIRTPLSGVFMAAQLLQQQLKLSNQPELIGLSDILVSSADHLSDIINDVLDMSKIEAGQIDISPRETSLEHMIHLLEKTQRHVAGKTGIELKVVIDPKMPPRLRFDPLRVRQCVTNLVNNALKFTTEGRVTIAALFDPETYIVTIHVIDTGIGISKEDQSKVFDHFSQVGQANSANGLGTGLGLAISRKFARLMGGDLTLASKLGKGTAFTLTFTTEAVSTDSELLIKNS